ncbi:MAG: DUF4115 domain-containing protein, partial [Elusimicrobia bacterium]|nr:DUF4115 domain-containing protein [Elusimicrobiota bacterium]
RAPAAPAARAARTESPAASATPAVIFAVLLALGVAIWLFHARPKAAPTAPSPVPKALLPVTLGAPAKVVLAAAADAWVRAAVDGTVVFEGRLPRGASMEWTPAREVDLRTTDPSALRVTVGGKPRELPAGTGGEYRIDTRPQ